MMTSTFSYSNGELGVATGLWSDFGPTTAIAQNFALGDNFPTEYPHYAGEAIRYHFLFYFQVGNLTYLGLDPATANNVLSIGSMLAMLVLVTALGERLFRNAAVGRIGAALFFFHGALSFIPYLAGLGSIERIINEVPNLSAFLSSGFPYRGEEWGIWSQIVFLNQRHLASAIGILLIIVIFLLDRIDRDERAAAAERRRAAPPGGGRRARPGGGRPSPPAADEPPAEPAPGPGRLERTRLAVAGQLEAAAFTIRHPVAVVRETLADPWLGGYVLCGVLAGMLPLWNGAMFIGAAAFLAVWLLVFPRRPSMLVLALVASAVAIPQLLWVRPGTMAGAQTYPSFYWGYIVDDPNLFNVARYLAFTFGPKLLLVAFAFVLVTWRERRVLIAFVALGAVAFLLQLSVEVLANHKFINAWLIVANLFVAYGLIRLWQARSVAGRACAVRRAQPRRDHRRGRRDRPDAGQEPVRHPRRHAGRPALRVGAQRDRPQRGLPDRPPRRPPHPPRRPADLLRLAVLRVVGRLRRHANGRAGTAGCSRTAVRATSSSSSRPRASTTSPSMTGCASGASPSA